MNPKYLSIIFSKNISQSWWIRNIVWVSLCYWIFILFSTFFSSSSSISSTLFAIIFFASIWIHEQKLKTIIIPRKSPKLEHMHGVSDRPTFNLLTQTPEKNVNNNTESNSVSIDISSINKPLIRGSLRISHLLGRKIRIPTLFMIHKIKEAKKIKWETLREKSQILLWLWTKIWKIAKLKREKVLWRYEKLVFLFYFLYFIEFVCFILLSFWIVY